MWRDTAVTRLLGLELPIVQGPMGNSFSPPRLVAAVSEAGALGSLGAYGLAPEALHASIEEIRAHTARPFAVNLWVPWPEEGQVVPDAAQFARALAQTQTFRDELGLAPPSAPTLSLPLYERQLEVLLALAPPVFSFVMGVPSADVLAACRARGIKTVGTATNLDEARALEQAGVDAIVASGAEAGGHRGLFRGQPSDALVGTIALVPLLRDAVKLPVIAAGGIADGRGVAAALALGAQAVQVGTAFLASDESGTSDSHRDALVGEAGHHTVVTRAFSGRYGRGIRNRLVEEVEADASAILPFPYQSQVLLPIRRAAGEAARADLQPMWAGQAAPLCRRTSAREVVSHLVADTERVLAALRSL